ncbi:MAG: helix-turn-helix domain-containing protein [Acidimicrobiia bacterium]|nr:helix-turn-helix domain-containing protein [Acidimicrobiia bacterium]
MSGSVDEFLRALRPVVDSLGGSIVPERSSRASDLPVEWQGKVVAFVRSPELHGALHRAVADIERELGTKINDMARADKQMAVRRLDERGVFLLRGAVDDVADLMGVSRVTLYSYLNAIDGDR